MDRAPSRLRMPLFALGLALTMAGAACSSGGSTSAPKPSSAQTGATMTTIGAGSIPDQTTASVPSFPAYYDAHKDIVLVTDAYPKAAATTYHVNYAPSLAAVKPSTQPFWYIVQGSAAAGQIAVLGSEPGETDYSPLWRTVHVTWKSGVTPVLLTSDNMISILVKKGQLTETTTSELVNATVISVGK